MKASIIFSYADEQSEVKKSLITLLPVTASVEVNHVSDSTYACMIEVERKAGVPRVHDDSLSFALSRTGWYTVLN